MRHLCIQTTCLLVPKSVLYKISSAQLLESLRSEQESADRSESQLAKEFIAKADKVRQRLHNPHDRVRAAHMPSSS